MPVMAEYTTDDPDEIGAALEALYGKGSARIEAEAPHFFTRAVGDERSQISRLSVTGRLVVRSTPLQGICVVRMRAGMQLPAVGTRSRAYLRDEMFAVPPDREITILAEELDEDVLFLDPARLDEVARQTLGAGLRKDAFAELSTADSRRLRPAGPLWGQLAALLTGADLHRYPLLYEETERTIALSVIDLFHALEDTPGRNGRSRVVRRAEEAMRSRLTEPLTMAAIADDIGVSVRHLQDSFRSQTGTTPTHRLRVLRLEAARDALIAADPSDAASVADIAHRWGFTHLSRFAQYYRAAYGELPRDTLRR